MNVMPNFFDRTPGIAALQPYGTPIATLDYSFAPPDMSGFTKTVESMIDSGNLFKYEDYEYLDGERVASNLHECVNLYGQTETGWEFKRRERIADGRNINFVVHNKHTGWFPEVKANHSDLVEVVDCYIKKYSIDVWKILVFKVDQDLRWHMDVDGFFGFRLFLVDKDDWTLKFRRVKPEWKDELRKMTWDGRWTQVHETIDETTFPDEISYKSKDTGQAFLINSMDYVHYFENTLPHYGVLVKGTV
jgi:hypothetical protein